MTPEESLFSDVPVRASHVCAETHTLMAGCGWDGCWIGRQVFGEEILRVFSMKVTLKGFAKHYDISYKTARKVLEKNGVRIAEIIAKQNHAGASLNELSRRHGPKPGTISKWIAESGYEVKHGHIGYRPDEERVARIYRATGSINACVEKLGIGWEKAAEILARLGLRRK